MGKNRKINSSGTTTIENYRNTVTDILNSYQNYAQILIPLTWKYSDSDTIYDNLISQVVENYMHGKVPLKEDLIETDEDGYLPEEFFLTPLEQFNESKFIFE